MRGYAGGQRIGAGLLGVRDKRIRDKTALPDMGIMPEGLFCARIHTRELLRESGIKSLYR